MRDRITPERFSKRLVATANKLGFISVGPFYTFLEQCSPTVRLNWTRAKLLKGELEKYLLNK